MKNAPFCIIYIYVGVSFVLVFLLVYICLCIIFLGVLFVKIITSLICSVCAVVIITAIDLVIFCTNQNHQYRIFWLPRTDKDKYRDKDNDNDKYI